MILSFPERQPVGKYPKVVFVESLEPFLLLCKLPSLPLDWVVFPDPWLLSISSYGWKNIPVWILCNSKIHRKVEVVLHSLSFLFSSLAHLHTLILVLYILSFNTSSISSRLPSFDSIRVLSIFNIQQYGSTFNYP